MKKGVFIKIDETSFIKVLNKADVTENYVMWLKDYEVTKFTEQKYFEHSLKRVEEFVIQLLRYRCKVFLNYNISPRCGYRIHIPYD